MAHKNKFDQIVSSSDQPLEIIQRLVNAGYEVISNNPVEGVIPGLKGQSENTWANSQHVAYIEDIFKVRVVFWGYEWITFHLPGGVYTPDFMYVLEDGRLIFLETKGSKRQSNYRDARSKLRGAATLNPWFTFYECRIDHSGNWEIEKIPPDGKWLAQYT